MKSYKDIALVHTRVLSWFSLPKTCTVDLICALETVLKWSRRSQRVASENCWKSMQCNGLFSSMDLFDEPRIVDPGEGETEQCELANWLVATDNLPSTTTPLKLE